MVDIAARFMNKYDIYGARCVPAEGERAARLDSTAVVLDRCM
jgi:hypothetical protein